MERSYEKIKESEDRKRIMIETEKRREEKTTIRIKKKENKRTNNNIIRKYKKL